MTNESFDDLSDEDLDEMDTSLSKYNIGDHIKVRRFGGIYSHHGVYIGESKVVHLTGGVKQGSPVYLGGMGNASIQIDDIHVFENGDPSTIVTSLPDKNKNIPEFIQFVESKLNDDVPYNIIMNNCEHFANELCTNTKKSKQVQMFTCATSAGTITIATAYSFHTFSIFGVTILPVAVTSIMFFLAQRFI